MFHVSSTNVSITRGDNATLCVSLSKLDAPYVLQDGDMLVLTVKDNPNDEEGLIQLVADDEGVFTFLPSSTNDIPFGNYKYDIQLTTSEGEVYTVIPVSTFTILEEVTWTANAPE